MTFIFPGIHAFCVKVSQWNRYSNCIYRELSVRFSRQSYLSSNIRPVKVKFFFNKQKYRNTYETGTITIWTQFQFHRFTPAYVELASYVYFSGGMTWFVDLA